ncbi:class I SAM-dependent methyltransferase [Halobacillus amylolyticus]|uniref:Class I SAM-dependent methyltransferase n=1 Tax=Halobacillus amylolyticus TaxID=2932259 RepID=A0ABY4HFV5_9BACI|nr:class I SAM-dependent methyltransferase [Halobacillus amylolyticus]UOR13504.1 class I SAM-dependent methyltransferase [Halobacillus amylolyticus]
MMNNPYLDLLAYFGIGGAHPGGIQLTKDLLSNEKILPNHYVLDIGCGTGQTAEFLTQTYVCRVTAVDNHPIIIEKAKKRLENRTELADVVKGNAQNLPFSENSFDLVLSESVVTFTDIDKTLSELFRVLKRNGHLIMIEMTAESPLSKSLHKEVCNLYGITDVLSEKEWTEKLRKAGFTHVEVISTPSELTQTEITDIALSENIGEELYDLWDEHTSLLEQSNIPLGYRVFRCN